MTNEEIAYQRFQRKLSKIIGGVTSCGLSLFLIFMLPLWAWLISALLLGVCLICSSLEGQAKAHLESVVTLERIA